MCLILCIPVGKCRVPLLKSSLHFYKHEIEWFIVIHLNLYIDNRILEIKVEQRKLYNSNICKWLQYAKQLGIQCILIFCICMFLHLLHRDSFYYSYSSWLVFFCCLTWLVFAARQIWKGYGNFCLIHNRKRSLSTAT